MGSYGIYVHDEANGWEPASMLHTEKEIRIGRSQVCEVVVDDPHCSKTHACFFFRDDRWNVRDLNTKNGTQLNSSKIAKDEPVKPGDIISIGSRTHLLFSTPELVAIKGTVSQLVDDLRFGSTDRQSRAQQALFKLYYGRLRGLARRKASDLKRAVEDEDDAVNSALGSVFGALRADKLPELSNRNELWAIMATFTARKVHRQRERQMALKRGAGQARVEMMDHLAASFTPVEADMHLAETVAAIRSALDDEQRKIFDFKREGRTTEEIAKMLDCSSRTVLRKLNKIYVVCVDLLRDD